MAPYFLLDQVHILYFNLLLHNLHFNVSLTLGSIALYHEPFAQVLTCEVGFWLFFFSWCYRTSRRTKYGAGCENILYTSVSHLHGKCTSLLPPPQKHIYLLFSFPFLSQFKSSFSSPSSRHSFAHLFMA